MNIRVLLCDDHALMRAGLRALLLNTPDIEIVGEVANGREAMQKVRELSPHVVLMDISMPELNGVEAARLIHERHSEIRIVILSMHSNAEHVHRALAAGATGYLLKDAVAHEVVSAVRAVFQGRQYLSESIADHVRNTRSVDGPLERLSTRERQVLQLVVEGKSSAEIARCVFLSPKTVETYRSRLMKKLGVSDVLGLVKFAVQHGLTTTE